MQFLQGKQEELNYQQCVLFKQVLIVIGDFSEGSHASSFIKEGHTALLQHDHIEHQQDKGMFDIPQYLYESIVSGEQVQDQVTFGHLVVAAVLREELVLLERRQGVVLVPTTDDLLLRLHYNQFFLLDNYIPTHQGGHQRVLNEIKGNMLSVWQK